MSATRDSHEGFSAKFKLQRKIIPLLVFVLFHLSAAITLRAAQSADAQSSYQPSPENLKARQDFQDMKFGMFIHWGVYSVLGDGEWVLHDRKLKLNEYERLPKFFDPEKFDAKTWVALAKAAGMKYITITSRHHDGFAMFDSKVSDWNIVQRTPYKKDPLKTLADECHRQGIKLLLLLFAARLAQSELLPAWPNCLGQRPPRPRRLERISR
jgi:hypothetical protein